QEGDDEILDDFERFGVERVEAVLSFFPYGDEFSFAEHLEVFRHRRLAGLEFRDDFGNADALLGFVMVQQHAQDISAGCVSDDTKNIHHTSRVALPRYRVATETTLRGAYDGDATNEEPPRPRPLLVPRRDSTRTLPLRHP